MISAVVAGDKDALGVLYDRYSPMLLALAQRILGNTGEAEDLLHDVFLEAWRCAASYDHERGTVAAWLTMRTRTRAIDRRRARARSRLVLLRNGRLPELGSPGDDLAQRAELASVRRGIHQLPRDLQVVLELGYFGGMTSGEIARAIEIPLGTVKSRLIRGLALLRASIARV